MNEKLSFGDVINVAQPGKKYQREGWNGKGMFISKLVPDENSKMGHPYFYMQGVDGKLFPWNPNNLDLFSTDWIEILD